MSFRTVETVLQHSRARGSARMVLVVIAECANHDGGDAWPAIDTIAHRAGISRASVFRCLRRLGDLGELEYDSKAGRKGCNRYRVTLSPPGEVAAADVWEAKPGDHAGREKLRGILIGRDGNACRACGRAELDPTQDHPNGPERVLQIDRVVPGGAYSVENTQLLCADCNRRKGTNPEWSHPETSHPETGGLTRDTGPSQPGAPTVAPVRPEPSREPPREPSSSPPDPLTAEWADDFAGWLAHHWAVTGMPAPRDGTAALDHIRRMYRARREEGYQATEIAMASEGAFANDYRREHGHFDHESVLRPTKIPKLIDAGRRLRAAGSAAGGDWPTWVAEHLPDLEGAAADMAAATAQMIASGGHELTPERVRDRVDRRRAA